MILPQIWERTDCAHEVRTIEVLLAMDLPFFPDVYVVPCALGECDNYPSSRRIDFLGWES